MSNVVFRGSKLLLFDKIQLYHCFTNKLWTKNASREVNTNFVRCQLNQATVSHSTPPVNILVNVSSKSSKPPCCLVNVQRHSSKDAYKDILMCLNELQTLLKTGNPVLIDVRTKEETWRTGVLPGSICVPLNELEAALKMPPEEFLKTFCSEKPSVDDTIVFVCKRGSRSFAAAKKAKELGYETVHSIQGGFVKWLDRQRRIREVQSLSEHHSDSDCEEN